MNDTNKPYSQRVSTLKNLYTKIKCICTRHIAIQNRYEAGDQATFSTEDNRFPMVYLETISDVSENAGKKSETFSVVLNVLDVLPENASDDQKIAGYDKCKQIMDEIKLFMEQKDQFNAPNVSTGQSLLFNDGDVVRVRTEMKLTVDKVLTGQAELYLIFPE